MSFRVWGGEGKARLLRIESTLLTLPATLDSEGVLVIFVALVWRAVHTATVQKKLYYRDLIKRNLCSSSLYEQLQTDPK